MICSAVQYLPATRPKAAKNILLVSAEFHFRSRSRSCKQKSRMKSGSNVFGEMSLTEDDWRAKLDDWMIE
jgi:hypothetical protein